MANARELRCVCVLPAAQASSANVPQTMAFCDFTALMKHLFFTNRQVRPLSQKPVLHRRGALAAGWGAQPVPPHPLLGVAVRPGWLPSSAGVADTAPGPSVHGLPGWPEQAGPLGHPCVSLSPRGWRLLAVFLLSSWLSGNLGCVCACVLLEPTWSSWESAVPCMSAPALQTPWSVDSQG